MGITVQRYKPSDKEQWDAMLQKSRNGLFLFQRDFMDYHADRFVDHSLLIMKDDKALGIFPANEKQEEIWSHAGLTFGGMITTEALRGKEAIEAMGAITTYYKSLGMASLYYKAIPYVYHRYPAQEDLYALFRNGAVLYRRDISSVIDLRDPLRFSESKRQAVTKCTKAGVDILQAADFGPYWDLLTTVLSKFGTAPVHSLQEIQVLQRRFPGQIKLYEARQQGELLAGIVVFDYDNVVHTQYMANSPEGRSLGALDFINAHLLQLYKERRYFSFGISTEEQGTVLNEGLLQQKEMMGARAIVNDFYKINL